MLGNRGKWLPCPPLQHLMNREARRLQRLRQRNSSSAPQDRATYQGYDAAAGGHQVKSSDGAVKLGEQISIATVGLNQAVQFVGGSFE